MICFDEIEKWNISDANALTHFLFHPVMLNCSRPGHPIGRQPSAKSNCLGIQTLRNTNILQITNTKIHLYRYTKAKIHMLNLSPALCQFKSPGDYTSTIYKIDTQPYMEKEFWSQKNYKTQKKSSKRIFKITEKKTKKNTVFLIFVLR